MKFKVDPRMGAGVIKFGMNFEKVRAALNQEFRSSNQIQLQGFNGDDAVLLEKDIPSRDLFESLGLVVIYNSSGNCVGINFFEKIVMLTFYERNLLGESSIEELRIWLDKMGANCCIENGWIVSYKFGVELAFADSDLTSDDYHYIQQFPPKEVVIFTDGFHDEYEIL